MKTITDYTELEFLAFIRKILNAEGETEQEDVENILEFVRLCEQPSGSYLIFYPENIQDDSPEGIVQQVKEWRKANGKPGFRGE